MDAISENAPLSFEIIALLGRELTRVRDRLQEVEQDADAGLSDKNRVLQDLALSLTLENQRLKAQLLAPEHRTSIERDDIAANNELFRTRARLREAEEANRDPELALRNRDLEERVQSLTSETQQLKAQVVSLKQKADVKPVISEGTKEIERLTSLLEKNQKTYEAKICDLKKSLEMAKERRNDTPPQNFVGPSRSFTEVMAQLPAVPGLPSYSELQPAFPGRLKPRKGLTQAAIKLCISPNYFYFTRQIAWWPGFTSTPCSDTEHALLPGADFRYQVDSDEQKWVPYLNRKGFASQMQELFYLGSDGRTYYAGTFKCITLPALTKDEYRKIDKTVKARMMSRSVPRDACSEAMYKPGVALATCLGFQRVGFNRQLCDQLQNDGKTFANVPKHLRRGVPTNNNPASAAGSKKRKDISSGRSAKPASKKSKPCPEIAVIEDECDESESDESEVDRSDDSEDSEVENSDS
ncbi:hypothetical protein JAAARDRAFT_211717 [Jaapia argillacea MUCL 33604]|uniref:Uncharacterized protein n=1 Tax=Jaapia argillacea MUCL 33604 TaxID=933084 RepID=A0A067PIV9_9AGAM|nr:hypothetical protein JAAARDRAFT_211717 [Jaapia argillacea MUCL 33604]